MKIFLIRHGESMQNTKENYEVKLPDHKVYLTNKGREEANKVGIFLKEYCSNNNISLSNSTLWISPYERTRETAKIINDYLNISKCKEDIALIEQRYGLFSDMDIEKIKEKYPNAFEFYDNYYRNDGKFYAKFPLGESPFDVALRTRQFIETIYRDKENILFIVTHGTVIKTFVMNFMHYSPEWYNNEPTPNNCSIRLIDNDINPTVDKYIYNKSKLKVKK